MLAQGAGSGGQNQSDKLFVAMNITYTDILVDVECWKCGIHFGIPDNFQAKRRGDHVGFYCPNGHPCYYTGKSELERLREQLEMEQKSKSYWIQEADARARQLSAHKGIATKLKRRIAHGVCPCCKRTFQQLSAHIENKHPDYLKVNGKQNVN